MDAFYYILGTLLFIGNTIFGIQYKPMLLSNEVNVPKDAIIERLSKKFSITECTMQCLHHHSSNCCGVGFLGEEMVNNGVWDTFTCFLLKKFECLSSNNGIIKLKITKMTNLRCRAVTHGERYPVTLPKDEKSAKTSQSSSYNKQNSYSEEKAVDGVYISDLSKRKCQHTGTAKPTETSWWQIEYNHSVLVHSVELYNRVDDCCGERLSNVNIFVFKDGVDGTRQYCGTTDADMTTKRYIKIICPQALEGNIIRIESLLGKVITLCEVDINGAFSIEDDFSCQPQSCHAYIELKNGRSATLQSNNVAGSVALRAIDGEIVQLQPNENCAYTTNSLGSWIKVHYDKKIILHRVQVYTDFYINGQQSQIEAYIMVSISMNEEFCGVFDDFRDGEQTINCVKDLIGNDVKFIKKTGSRYDFVLCEVKIFGRYL